MEKNFRTEIPDIKMNLAKLERNLNVIFEDEGYNEFLKSYTQELEKTNEEIKRKIVESAIYAKY